MVKKMSSLILFKLFFLNLVLFLKPYKFETHLKQIMREHVVMFGDNSCFIVQLLTKNYHLLFLSLSKTIHKPFFKSENNGGINVYVTYIFFPFLPTSAVFSRQLPRTEGLAGRYTVPKCWTTLAERLFPVPVDKQTLINYTVYINYSIIHSLN